MPKITEVKPADPPKPTPRKLGHPALPNDRYGSQTDEGSGDIIFSMRITNDVAKRLRTRCGPEMDIARYIYENITYRAVVDHVY